MTVPPRERGNMIQWLGDVLQRSSSGFPTRGLFLLYFRANVPPNLIKLVPHAPKTWLWTPCGQERVGVVPLFGHVETTDWLREDIPATGFKQAWDRHPIQAVSSSSHLRLIVDWEDQWHRPQCRWFIWTSICVRSRVGGCECVVWHRTAQFGWYCRCVMMYKSLTRAKTALTCQSTEIRFATLHKKLTPK